MLKYNVNKILQFFFLFNGIPQDILCNSGMHKIRKGFGRSGDKRMDVCLCNGCNWSIWVIDIKGNQKMREEMSLVESAKKSYKKKKLTNMTFIEYVGWIKDTNPIYHA